MSKILKFKRGNTAKNNAYTGAAGELTVDTTKKTVVVHDGVTTGGSVLATDVTVSAHTSRVDNPHGVSKIQVGLGNVLNVDSTNPNNIVQDSTHRFVTDSDKTNWNGKINATEKAVANGVATLDINGKIVLTQIPDSVLGQLEYMGTYSFSIGMPIATQKGQYWVASTDGNGYITGDWAVWNGSTFDKVDNTDAVATVAGRIGNVVLNKSDVGLSNVDNTSDANKPVSTATQTALNLKANIASPTFTGTVTAPTFSGALSGNASTATKLATARTIGTSGDVTTTAQSFDGSANITIPMTLATVTDSGTGTFKKVTVDTKGRVTGTAAVAQADITGLLGAGSITNAMLSNGSVANLSGINTGDQTITLTGDVTGTGTGSFATTLANSGVTAGTYKSVTVDVKGRVTAASNPTTISGYGITDAQPLDGDLTSIAGLSGTSGILKKTAANTWTLDTNTYVTSSGVTSVSGTAPIVSSGGNNPVISINAATTSAPGSMSAADKTKLDGIETGANNYVLPTASSTVKGGVELFSDTVQSVASNAVTSTASRTYGIQLNSDGQAVVNVPWVDTNTVYTHPTGDGNLHVPATGTTNNGKVLMAGATAGSLSWQPIPSAPVSSVNGMTGAVTVSTITGNAGTATKLATGRTIVLSGDVSGSTTFDGSGNVTLSATVADNSHNHVISNVDGLQAALDSKATQSNTYTKTEIDGFIGTSDSASVKLIGDQTIDDVKTFSSNIVGNITGNSGTATKLSTARTINGISFDGTGNITIADNTKLPLTGGTLTGAVTVPKLTLATPVLVPTLSELGSGGSALTYINHNTLAVGVTGYMPWMRHSVQGGAGYINQNSIGSYRGSDTWTNSGVYIATGGNDGRPTEAFQFINGRIIRNTAGAISLEGNAATATKLQTARTINGVSFDGTANIVVADNTKAPLSSPSLVGVPTAPTASVGTNTTQLATTAFVVAEINKIEEW